MLFTRTITKSRIYASVVKVENGEVVATPLASFEVLGVKVTEKNAMKFAKKHYGKEMNLIIRDIEVTEVKYSMDLETFLEYAEMVEESEPESLLMKKIDELNLHEEFIPTGDFEPTED